MAPVHVHQEAPAPLHRKRLVAQGRAIGLQNPLWFGRQLDQGHLSEQAARKRPQHETSVRTDALVGPQGCDAIAVLPDHVRVECEIADRINAGIRAGGVGLPGGSSQTQRAGQCNQVPRLTPGQAMQPIRGHFLVVHVAPRPSLSRCPHLAAFGAACSKTWRRSSRESRQAVSGMTPRMGHTCTLEPRNTRLKGR